MTSGGYRGAADGVVGNGTFPRLIGGALKKAGWRGEAERAMWMLTEEKTELKGWVQAGEEEAAIFHCRRSHQPP